MATSPAYDHQQRRHASSTSSEFGTFLSNMVMPNIGAFIAWGLITALFIETGWITLVDGWSATTAATGSSSTSAHWGKGADGTGIVGPMITYLLPILIALHRRP